MPPFIRHTHTLQGGAVRGTLKVTNFVSRICYVMSLICLSHVAEISWHDTATHCNTLRHAATQHIQIRASVQHQTYIDNTLQHTATHCNTLQHTATQHIQLKARVQHQRYSCNTLQHAATHCKTLQHTATQHKQLKARVQHQRYTCNTLQHTAKHCNTLQNGTYN